MRSRIPLIAALMLLASPLYAYVVIMKDGTKIFARQKYDVRGGNAIITLENGIVTDIALTQIDVVATDRYNKENAGNVTVMDTPEVRAIQTPPSSRPTRVSLGDYIKQHPTQPGAPPATTGGPAAGAPAAAPPPSRASAAPTGDQVIEREVSRILEAAGVMQYRVFAGPKVTVVAAGEDEVFRALSAAARLTTDLAGIGKANSLSLEITASDGSDGGKFKLTPDLVAGLNAGSETPSEFFVKNVLF